MHRWRDMATESNTQSGASDTNQPSGAQASERPGEPQATIQHPPQSRRGAFELARRHPALTVAGAATLGLFGGVEAAAGILLGAAILALVRDGAAPSAAPSHRVRDRVRELWNDLPQTVRERTRAVVQAARGKPTGQSASASTQSAD
jgi:hypothetical protein